MNGATVNLTESESWSEGDFEYTYDSADLKYRIQCRICGIRSLKVRGTQDSLLAFWMDIHLKNSEACRREDLSVDSWGLPV